MDALKWLRDEKEENQQDLAELLKVSQSAIGKWERGENEPGIENLIKLADHYNVSIDYLVGRSNIKQKHPSIDHLLKEYLTRKFNRVYSDEDIDTVDKILELLEKYRE